MASLIPTSSKTDFTTALNNHFDTFKETITVYKEPRKVISNTSKNIYAGYGAQKEIITYQTVSSDFEALVNFRDRQSMEFLPDIKIQDIRGDVRIKVAETCKDYIKGNGKTESIVVQGKSYNVITDDGAREYLGVFYYVFHLEATT
jgi:hypothetical protein